MAIRHKRRMRKFIDVLMDIALVLVFILVSSGYIDTFPRYIPRSNADKTAITRNNENTGDKIGENRITAKVKSSVFDHFKF